MMEKAARRFAEHFSHWGITLPQSDLDTRTHGVIRRSGWTIQYCFGKDEKGEYLDFYSSHRMTDDDHFRIYEGGECVELEALQSGFVTSDDPDEAKRLEEEFYAANRRISEMLAAKGFGALTINVFIRSGGLKLNAQ